MIEFISRITVGLMAGSIIYKAQEAENWDIVIRILILFAAFLINIRVR